MKRRLIWLFLVIVILVICATVITIVNHQKVMVAAGDVSVWSNPERFGKRTPVIVELFTSEGCSSCPPADEVLAKLERTQPIEGAEIIALGEHVDYWNYIGWSDPFSSPIFGTRQGSYAEAFGLDGNYTPQMVVDGRAEFVGSNWNKAVAAIAQAARVQKAEVQISLSRIAVNDVALQVRVTDLPTATSGETIDLLLAMTEDNLSSNVLRGENAGRKLTHRTVVRQLSVISSAEAKNGVPLTAVPTVTLEKNWKTEHLRAVVFAQERKSRRVIGAGVLKLSN